MKEVLEQLIQQVQKTQLVERLASENSLQERVNICKEAKQTAEFVSFRESYDRIIGKLDPEEEGSAFSYGEFYCTKDNAIEVAVILIIEGIDDVSVFDSYAAVVLTNALKLVCGTHKNLALRIADFLEGNLITLYTLEELLDIIF